MRRGRTAAWAKWRTLVSQQERSPESVAEFCRRRGLSSGQFFAWRRRLRSALQPSQFVPVKVLPVAETSAAAESVPRCSAIEVRLRGGRSLLVEPGFDAAHLRQLLQVLEV